MTTAMRRRADSSQAASSECDGVFDPHHHDAVISGLAAIARRRQFRRVALTSSNHAEGAVRASPYR
jgi:hypothetical protein